MNVSLRKQRYALGRVLYRVSPDKINYSGFDFKVEVRDSKTRAKLGCLTTPHGQVMTPAFIFIATKGAIRAASPRDLELANVEMILANTYHLLVQPGPEIVAKAGGLQGFMGWSGPLLTDSGGFQIFSLGAGVNSSEVKSNRIGAGNVKKNKLLLKLDDEGAVCFAHLRMGKYTLTPESAISIQRQLRPDIAVVLDECTPANVERKYTEDSLNLTHRWAKRSLSEFERHHDGTQALYGIVQGGVYQDLRREGAEFVASLPFWTGSWRLFG